jgi:hypothetical protein
MMKNCLTFALYAKWRLKRGKIIIYSWSGAWRKTEWPRTPHFALLIENTIIHYDSLTSSKLPIWKMINFEGRIFRKKSKQKRT